MGYRQENGKESLEGINEIVISAISGDIRVEKAPEGETEVLWDAYWKNEEYRTEVRRDGDRLIIRFDEKQNFVKFFGINIHFGDNLDYAVVKIPDKIPYLCANLVSGDFEINNCNVAEKVKVTSTSGDIKCNLLKSKKLSLSTKSGDIYCTDVYQEERLTIKTISGDVAAERVSAKSLHAESKSGDIKFKDDTETMEILNVHNVSGDIFIKSAGGNVNINTVSGDIIMHSIEKGDKKWIMNTVSGDISIEATDMNGVVVFDSLSGECSFKGEKPVYRNKKNYQYGDGSGGEILVKTVSGDLSVRVAKHSEAEEDSARKEYTEEERAIAIPPMPPIPPVPPIPQVPERKTLEPDEDASRIIQTCIQGIITKSEAREMLEILDYGKEEIEYFMKLIEEE